MDPWKTLAERWPFQQELDEVPSLNATYHLVGDHALSSELRPVFFVGDLSANPDFLLVGMKPGLNQSSNLAFQREREALAGDFERYKASRVEYFRSDALNKRHYWPAAKAIATLLGEPFPRDPGDLLAKHAVQVELLPFFASSAGLPDKDFLRLRRESTGGQLAHRVLESLLTLRPWTAVIVRYQQTMRLFCEISGAGPASTGGTTFLSRNGRGIPVYCLPGRYVSDSEILGLGPGLRTLRLDGTPATRCGCRRLMKCLTSCARSSSSWGWMWPHCRSGPTDHLCSDGGGTS